MSPSSVLILVYMATASAVKILAPGGRGGGYRQFVQDMVGLSKVGRD